MFQVNEIFYSLQGEGHRKGTANVFVRFSGCNLTCSADGEAGFDCDTEFVSGVRYTLGTLVEKIATTWSAVADEDSIRWVIFTGGEPGLQLTDKLVAACHRHAFRVAVETNGTKELPSNIDWICCSPKSAEHTLRIDQYIHELRYVRNGGQGIPHPKLKADHYYLSPAFNANGKVDPAAMKTCQNLCLTHPKWNLSVQDHKTWGLR